MIAIAVSLIIALAPFAQAHANGNQPAYMAYAKPKVDLMIIATHPDDDQLWLGAVGPTYTNAGKRVITVCMTYDATKRRGQYMINGRRLVKDWLSPVFGGFPDLYGSEPELKRVWSEEKMQTFLVEQIRKYKPAVIVTQDTMGEYGHFAHKWMVSQVQKAVVNSVDKTKYTASASKYGTWNTLKLYLHLYPYNKIVLNVDRPLAVFGGKTAFQMAQAGFKCHVSQDRGFWVVSKVTDPSELLYSCREFGLYRSLVGYANTSNNMFEGVTLEALYLANPWIRPKPQTIPEIFVVYKNSK